MKLINHTFEILSNVDDSILKNIERAGRVCYKSEDLITKDSSEKFIKKIIDLGHESVLEHEKLTVLFTIDRGVSHEAVRHRLASFSQESTRYCNYSKDKFKNEITFVDISEFLKNPKSFDLWVHHMLECEKMYFKLLEMGETPQIARSVLPNSLKTDIVITANLREWRLIFKQRTAGAAHPQMRMIMRALLRKLKIKLPIIFNDITY